MIEKFVRMAFVVLAVCLMTCGMTGVSAAESEQPPGGARPEYRLGPQDKVSIKVYEWRPSRDEIYEWSAFNKAEYMVNSSGSLSLPLLGEVPASGKSTAQLASDLGERLKDRMGLLESPDVTIEVIEHRPFYIVGSVEKPGGYPYRPGLTILEAYALAGGNPRSALGSARLQRESISTRGELNAYSIEMQNLMARLARLKAELADADKIDWPAELKSHMHNEVVSSTVKQEQLLFDARREAFHTQTTALEQLKSYLEDEVTSLEKQLKVHETEVNTVNTEFKMVQKLYKKGLTAAPRKLALERNVAQVRGERLRMESNLMRARQEISKTKISIIELRGKRNSQLSDQMQKAQARLDELRSRTQTSKNLLFETEVLAPQMLAQEGTKAQAPIFKVVHQGQPLSSERVVSQEELVQPGDTITVRLPLRESSLTTPAFPAPALAPRASATPTPTASIDVSNERLR
jgi:protein involved in polysaccharide export with SLBB domain